MIAQISLDLHGVGIKLKNTQLRIFQNVIKIQIMIEFSTEDKDSKFQLLFILSLVFLSDGKYRFNHI